MGLLVDALHGVPGFQDALIMLTPFAGHDEGALVKHFIKANQGRLLIQVVGASHLFSILMLREASAETQKR